MSKGCRGGFYFGGYVRRGGEEERRSVGRAGGLSAKGGWMRGKGQNMPSGYILIDVK